MLVAGPITDLKASSFLSTITLFSQEPGIKSNSISLLKTLHTPTCEVVNVVLVEKIENQRKSLPHARTDLLRGETEHQ